MNPKLRNLYGPRLCIAAVAAVLLTVTGCTSTGTRTEGQKTGDSEIAKGVKKGLAADPTFKYNDVVANVYDGNIQLTGFVETPEQRLRAAEIASHTRGARQVINSIMIKATPALPVAIRDPLGEEKNQILVDTNSPPPQLRNLPASGAATEPGGQGATDSTKEGSTPKQ